MSAQQQPIEPTEADFVAAALEWSKKHDKTDEQMLHLTIEEAGDCYRLAQAYALMRLMGSISSEREAGEARTRSVTG